MATNKRSYKKHLHSDNPIANAPKTSKWRIKKKLKETAASGVVEAPEEISHSYLEVDVHADSDFNTSTPESKSDHIEILETEEEQGLNDSWYDSETKTDLFEQDENSIWFDARDVFDETDESFKNTNTPENCEIKDEPLYKGAPLSVAESAILILTFVMRHNLTGECLSDLLTLVSLHCISTNAIHASLYRFRSYFSSLKAPLVFHKFCCKCEYLVEDSSVQCAICKSDLTEKNKVSYFVQIPLLFQIQQLFQRKDFHLKLLHRFTRKKKNFNNIEDIYDGKLYKLHSKADGFLNVSSNISLMWYTDGVPLFKSSKVSIWPLFLSINELPVQDRFKQENIIFAGLWFGHSKPSMLCFLKPFHDVLKEFRDIGYKINCMHCSTFITVKGMLLCGTCDLPAKSMVLNMNQFNGKYGCPKCKQEGKVVKTGKGHTRVFPFDDLINQPMRTHNEFIENGELAFATSKPVLGVKGPSWWANCCADIINGTAIDYMHCVLLGLVRRLLQLWFDPKFSSQSFSIAHLVSVADRRLSSIKPPYYIKRHPRDIKEQSKYWKASECRAWLFFYSIPVLFGLLNKSIFEHYLLLVEAIFILNLDSISETDLKHCDELLIKFSCIFSVLYGEQHMSANLHQLLHMHDQVEQLGPLWVYSCFSFESMNGSLVKLFHGTQNPVIQIANTVSTMLKLPAFAWQIKNETPVGNFYVKLNSSNYHYKLGEKIFNGAYVIGAKHLKTFDAKFDEVIIQCTNFALGDCYMFYRLMLNGTIYHSEKYNTYSRNSCTVVYIDGYKQFCGQIMFYAKVYPFCYCSSRASCVCAPTYLAVIRKIKSDSSCPFICDRTNLVHAKLNNIFTGKLTDDYTAVLLDRIIGLAILMTFSFQGDTKVCVSMRPNLVECD